MRNLELYETMSTQDRSGVEFSILAEENQEHLRLLELPAQLLDLLTSNEPPILQLKSGSTGQADANAVICTEDRTWDIRQVSTSNSVFVTQTVSSSDDNGGQPKPGLQAIAKPQSMLEVTPVQKQSAIPYISTLLPAYTSTGHYSSKDAITKEQVFADIPMSDVACDNAWTELCCFELGEQRHGLIPSASVILQVWQFILDSTIATRVDLTQPFRSTSQFMVVTSDNDLPEELLIAVLKSMAARAPDSNDSILDESKCAKVIGQNLLKDRTKNSTDSSISVCSFKSQWADLLPEKWRASADLKFLDGLYKLENSGQDIMYVGDASSTAGGDKVAPAETKSTLGVKRKWHEKFRASKKTA